MSEGAEEFHFSPRPNRAAEINWHPWSATAFEAARSSGRPILLSISAVWCHWCHVMDETTYSHPGIIDLINREYVPIRVDNDVRPDINQRYNMGPDSRPARSRLACRSLMLRSLQSSTPTSCPRETFCGE